MLKYMKFNMNPFAVMLAAGLLMMVLSAFSIEMVSAAYGFDFDEFDLATEMMVGDISVFELLTEFTLPLSFIFGVFLAAGGFSGWLLFYGQNSLNSASVS